MAAVGFELYVSMLDEAVAALAGDSADEAPEPVRVDLPVDAYVPGDYVPYEAAKIEVHRRVAGAKEVADLIVLREELEDRFGPVPEPLDNLIRLQDARIKLGRAGARTVGLHRRPAGRGARSSSTRGGCKIAARAAPEAVYESGRSTRARARAGRARRALPRGGGGRRGDPRGGHRRRSERDAEPPRYHAPPPRPARAARLRRRTS